MENMPLGGYGEQYGEYALGGGYGEQYGEYAFWGGMENMPSGGVWRICLLGGVWRTV